MSSFTEMPRKRAGDNKADVTCVSGTNSCNISNCCVFLVKDQVAGVLRTGLERAEALPNKAVPFREGSLVFCTTQRSSMTTTRSSFAKHKTETGHIVV